METPAWLEREDGSRVPVTGNCSLGRAVGNDVVLVDDRVSRRHATIHAQGVGQYWLVDLGSRNGTYLNGRRVSQPTHLHGGDRIQLGPFALRFQQATSAAAPRTLTPSAAEQTQVDLRSAPCWLLLCDIAGSTRLSRERGGDELSALFGGWFARCKEVIEDNGGAINKYLGDALFAYWLSRDPALPHLAQTLRDLRELQEESSPPFRVVVHHGEVLFGGMPSTGEESLAGSTVNFVFRLERLASTIGEMRLASRDAVRLLDPALTFTPVGQHPLDGFDGGHELFSF